MKTALLVLLISVAAVLTNPTQAMPLAELKIFYWKNYNGSYTYIMKVKNNGPIAANVTTPANHQITRWLPDGSTTIFDAGDKYLTDDENLVVFGVDTKRDDLIISNIRDGSSAFQGEEEAGFFDSDNNGIANQIIAWHLPFFGWTLEEAINVDETLLVSFTLSEKVDEFDVWVGGSDDAVIWNDQHTMIEDEFGIYDGTDEVYLASFLTRKIKAKTIFFGWWKN